MREAFICDGVRTPIGRYGGALSGKRPDDLAALLLRSLINRHGALDPGAIDEVIFGCANQSGEDSRNVGRMATLLAGIPDIVPAVTVNRLCASGLEAVGQAARAIAVGEADLIFAGGVESMTRAPFAVGKPEGSFSRTLRLEDTTIGWRFINPAMARDYGVHSMPETAENVAMEYRISRDDQDAFALRSQERTAKAGTRGFLAGEIEPVTVADGKKERIIDADEHPRPETTRDGLSKLKPLVRPDGTVTAGNSSGINDGAAALILASEAGIKRHGLRPLARVLAYATTGIAPRIMGMGPVGATSKLLSRTGLRMEDFGVIEVNEAFSAQVLAVLRQFKIPDDAPHVNPNGGAIALGHPLGASGARLVLTAVRALAELSGGFALVTLCVGVGQGAALAIQSV